MRHCYGELLESSTLYKERRERLEGILIAGTPGIGKSHMAGLVVAQLLLSGRVVLLELASPNSPAGSGTLRSFFRMQLKADGEASVHEVTNSSDALRWLRHEHRAVNYDKAKAPAYVVDGGLPSLAFGTFANEGHCFWQFSSAQPGILREINKGAAYKAFYPPLFTLPELLHLKANVADFAGLSDGQVRDAYAIMGGIARPVLFLQSRGDKSVADLRDDVKAKIARMGETGWKALYDTLEGDKGFHDGSDMIVHWDALETSSTPQPRKPNSPESDSMRRYTRHRAQLASPYVAALLSIRMGLAEAERCAMFAVSHGTRGCVAGMVGKMHESLSHIFLAGGGDFECRMIDSGKEFILRLPKSKDVEMFQSTADAVTLATAPDANRYLMPASATYPAIDSFKTLAILFQMAAGKTHDINRPGMYELVQAFSQDQMDTALQDLQGMTGLTEQDLPGRMPVIFFATMPESYDDGFRSLQKYVARGKNTAQGPLAHQAVLKIPHKLLDKMSAQQQASIIAEIAKELQQLAGPAADMDEG